jgi:hypothetical protein
VVVRPLPRVGVYVNTTRIIIFAVTVAAIVVLIVVTGWGDDKAERGSGGRVPVTSPAQDDPP